MHIEQGPVLEQAALPIGIVTAIAGLVQATASFTGRADHAGTTPMNMRHDACQAAAEATIAVDQLVASLRERAVATVGQIKVEPGVTNVVPSFATISVDLRSPDDDLLAQLSSAAAEEVGAIGQRRGVATEWHVLQG